MPGEPTVKEFVGVDFHECLARVRGRPRVSAFLTIPSPQELHAIYSRGYQGVRPESTTFEEKNRFKDMMAAMPSLYDAFPWAKDFGKGRINCPYVAILKNYPEWGGQDAQERGDCTVHGTYNAAAMDYGVDCLFGETKWMGPLACENIYRSRGFNSDGWSCEAPCTYVGPDGRGGFLYRKVWTSGSESVDLSKYNSSWEGNGRAGVPAWMEAESQKNKVKLVIPINNKFEHRDAIAIGFGINCCSGQGFSSSTDEFGVARAQGSWSHSMAHTASIDTEWAHTKYGDMIGGIQQSWGNWNTINGKPEGSPKMPVGMFYSKISTIESRMLGGDSFALCGLWGWERTNWEAFNVADYKTELYGHLNDSTVRDRYEARAKWLREQTERAVDELNFLAI